MTRCIHCTRCVRFVQEIMFEKTLGTIGRGNNMEIARSPFDLSLTKTNYSFYTKKENLDSELTNNLIAICPVGALTSKFFAFKERGWDWGLKSPNFSWDLNDGSMTRLTIEGSITAGVIQVKATPKSRPTASTILNQKLESAKEVAWITDKTKYGYDGLKYQRLIDRKIKETNTNQRVTQTIPEFIVGNNTGIEPLLIIKHILAQNKLDTVYIRNTESKKKYFCHPQVASETKSRNKLTKAFNLAVVDFIPKINTTVGNTNQIFLLSTKLRYELPKLNLSLITNKKRIKRIIKLGAIEKTAYKTNHLGQTLKTFLTFIEGRDPNCKGYYFNTMAPLFFLSSGLLQRSDNSLVYTLLENLFKNIWFQESNTIQVIHTETTSMNAQAIGITPFNVTSNLQIKKVESINTQIFLGSLNTQQIKPSKHKEIITLSSHGTKLVGQSDFVLPTYACLEDDDTTHISTEGYVIPAHNGILAHQKNLCFGTSNQDTLKLLTHLKTITQTTNIKTKNLTKVGISTQTIYPTMLSEKPTKRPLPQRLREHVIKITQQPTQFNASNIIEKNDYNDSLYITSSNRKKKKSIKTISLINKKLSIKVNPLYSLIDNFYFTNTTANFSRSLAKILKTEKKTTLRSCYLT